MSAFEELWGLPTREFEPSDLGQTTESDFEPMETFSQGARKVLADPGVTVEEAASDEASSGSEEVEVEAAEPSAEELAAAEQAAAEEAAAKQAEAVAEAQDAALLKAQEEGFAIGRSEGLEAGRAEIENQVSQLKATVEKLSEIRRGLFSRSVQDLSEAVIHIARRVVGEELRVGGSSVEGLVRAVLEDVRVGEEVVVKVSESDAESLRAAYPELLELVGRDGELRIEVDSGLEPGGATVQTSLGRIDASVESQFQAFAETLQEWAASEVETGHD